jgi:hypothetical protein
MLAVRADDSGEHERDHRHSGHDCKSVRTIVNRSGSMLATTRHAFTAGMADLARRVALLRSREVEYQEYSRLIQINAVRI